MNFSPKTLTAIVKAGKTMVQADGRILDSEMAVVTSELSNLGVSHEEIPDLLRAADSMPAPEMIQILSSLDEKSKRHTAGFLAAIMVIDGDIDDTEVRFWRLVCTLACFPAMNLSEALSEYQLTYGTKQ